MEYLRFGQFKNMPGDYIRIACLPEGVYISYMSHPEDDNAIYMKNNYRTNKVYLPKRIIQQYGFGDMEPIVYIDPETRFIKSNRQQKAAPMPYKTNFFKINIPEESAYERIKDKNIHPGGRVTLSHSTFGDSLIVKLLSGDKQCIVLEPYNGEDIPTLAELKLEYGNKMLAYPYADLCYKYEEERDIKTIGLCGFMLRSMGLQDGDTIRYIELKDGRVLLTPSPVKCAIDKEEVKLEKKKPKEAFVCRECSNDTENNGDMTEMILLLRETMSLCNQVMKQNKKLTARIKEIESKIL